MKVHFTGIYRYQTGFFKPSESEERYEFDWEGENFDDLFKLVIDFEKKHVEAEEAIK